jgi:hypothetical protein
VISRRPPLHPALFVAAYVLSKALSEDVAPAGFVRPLGVVLLAAGFATLAASAVARSWALGGILASGAFLLLASHRPVVSMLSALGGTLGIGVASVVLVILVTTGVVLIAAAATLIRRRRSFRADVARLGTGLDVFSGILTVVVLLGALPSLPVWIGSHGTAVAPEEGSQLPDVYLILLDGYPRADELTAEFQLDNSPFVDSLTNLGFSVQAESNSNYTNTALTLPSLIGMSYLGTESVSVYSDSDLRRLLVQALREGAGLRGFREAGYETFATSPGWEDVTMREGVRSLLGPVGAERPRAHPAA